MKSSTYAGFADDSEKQKVLMNEQLACISASAASDIRD
jgi:hypothetical protein